MKSSAQGRKKLAQVHGHRNNTSHLPRTEKLPGDYGFTLILLFILTSSLVVSDFVDEESKVQRSKLISLKSHSRWAWAKIQISLTPNLVLFL